MQIIGDLGAYVVPFLIILTILVFVHELGHYWVARRAGVKVEVFSIGFGPELFGWNDRAGTRWKFSIVPLGGYVKMFGDSGAASTPGEGLDEMPPEQRAVSFHHKALWQRFLIVLAGPLANFIFAIVLLAGLFVISGQPFTPAVVGEVVPDSPAAEAGFQPEDRIVAIDGQEIARFEEVQRIVALRPGQELRVTVERDGSRVALEAVPQRVEQTDVLGNTQEIGRLGISRRGVEYVRHGPASAVWQAVRETAALSVSTLEAVGQIITGTRNAEELGGPLRIAQMSGEVANLGLIAVIWFMAVLSVNLGLINLFPIPMLDGGHLLFYLFEAVRGKPLGERMQEYGFRIGLALVFSLMLFVTWNDLAQLRVFEFLRGLVT
ncbi:MAG: RIP metalloprotease RseP [Rhodovibrionaceae bacterium]|nr:RIP metalloprotease RseP [Rhodovibrionaceae bacterium]